MSFGSVMRTGKKHKNLLFAVLTFSMVAILVSASLLLYHFDRYSQAEHKLRQVELLSNRILYLDETLTMSASLSVLANSAGFKSRYDQFDREMTKALQQLVVIAPQMGAFFHQISELNRQLVMLEYRAFELMAERQAGAAEAVLFGDDYAELKQRYKQQVTEALQQIQSHAETLATQHQYWYQAFIGVLIAQAFLYILVWGYLLHYTRRDNLKMADLIAKDELTGLLNRREFNRLLELESRRCIREERVLMLAVIDIDFFKKYNDQYGHPKGDQVLAGFGRLLSRHSRRANEFAFRLGGEEFAVLASLKDVCEGECWIGAMFEELAAMQIPQDKNPLGRVTASAGLAFQDKSCLLTGEELYTKADKALYKAKENGRNRWVIADQDDMA